MHFRRTNNLFRKYKSDTDYMIFFHGRSKVIQRIYFLCWSHLLGKHFFFFNHAAFPLLILYQYRDWQNKQLICIVHWGMLWIECKWWTKFTLWRHPSESKLSPGSVYSLTFVYIYYFWLWSPQPFLFHLQALLTAPCLNLNLDRMYSFNL